MGRLVRCPKIFFFFIKIPVFHLTRKTVEFGEASQVLSVESPEVTVHTGCCNGKEICTLSILRFYVCDVIFTIKYRLFTKIVLTVRCL
jgi:hypothetical protein